MMTIEMTEPFIRPFQIELMPPTRWDAAQAVLYRVGESLTARDLADPSHEFSVACREALTGRLLPWQGLWRRRWLSAVLTDSPADLDRPPHERPGLLAAASLSFLLPGGLLAERLDDFGPDPVHRAVIITWLAEHAGFPGPLEAREELEPGIAVDPARTFTVGDLGNRYGRRAWRDGSSRTVQDHVKRLNREAMITVSTANRAGEYADLYARFDEARDQRFGELNVELCMPERATHSQLFADLGVEAAADCARRMESAGAPPGRVRRILQLAGFLNGSGHRLWNPSHVKTVGRQAS